MNFICRHANDTITRVSRNFYQIEIYVYYKLFLGALVVIVQLGSSKMQMNAAVAKIWKNVWRHCLMNGCFKTMRQLQNHILGAHVGIALLRSVKWETTALVVKKWRNVHSYCQMNGCLKAWKLQNV